MTLDASLRRLFTIAGRATRVSFVTRRVVPRSRQHLGIEPKLSHGFCADTPKATSSDMSGPSG
jgi:hypothetical protein